MRRQGLLVGALAAGAAWGQSEFVGEWIMRTSEFEQPFYNRLVLRQEGGKLTASIRNAPVEVVLNGREIVIKGDRSEIRAVLSGDEMLGEVIRDGRTDKWRAERVPARPAQPQTHDFEPTQFHLYFSSMPKPVLRIFPGDTVRTWSVDAGGAGAKGVRRSMGGNPQTGPFYIEGAVPGDTLAVRLDRVRLNRDWAGSGSRVMASAIEPFALGAIQWTQGFSSRWRLDRERGVAYVENSTPKLKNFAVPLAPMLGCVGVAPPGEASVRTTDSGRFGGNMDYNQIREGATVYLPVYHPGALLFLGDGHAAQGDGELTGDALETSMDFEFTVDLIKGRQFGHPLAENAEYLMSIGIGGSLPEALQMATSGMMRWLDRDYKLSASESAMVLGFAVKYDVVDLVGTQVSIAAKLPKTILATLEKVEVR